MNKKDDAGDASQKAATHFFELLRLMIMDMAKNHADPGEMRELTYLSNYIKDAIAEAMGEYEHGFLPILQSVTYGHRDGRTFGKFMVARDEAIMQSWKLRELAKMLDDAAQKWETETLTQEPEGDASDFDMTPYSALKKHTGKK